MIRYILIFGSISGMLVAGMLWLGVTLLAGENGGGSMLFGYLSMLIALSFIFVAIKRYRDKENGGVIKFWPALGLGILVSLVAGFFYVAAWEAYLATTDGNWMANYIEAEIATREAAGASAAEIAAFRTQMQGMADNYAHWWFRIPLTLAEILPVGLLISLISAGILRNPKILPHRPQA
jgi:hypothetical protein